MMAGAYCRYCGHRCFVDRVLPDFSWSGHLATCAAGAAFDREQLGHDYTTALNLIAPEPDGLEVRQVKGDDRWQVVHIESGKHIPLIDWPPAGLPRRYTQIAAASLATSGIDWTRSASDLVDDLRQVADAARTASTVAYDGAVHAGDRADERPRPFDLATRRAPQRTDQQLRNAVRRTSSTRR